METTALLLIDLQRDFLETGGRMPVNTETAESLIATANRLIRHAERQDWHIIFVKNEFRKSDWLGNFFRRYAAIEGSSGADLDPRIIIPAISMALLKAEPNAFSNPDLTKMLHDSNVSNIVAVGVMAEGCVRATVVAALKRGYSVTVAADGVASTRDFLRRFGIKRMLTAGAQIKESSEILNHGP